MPLLFGFGPLSGSIEFHNTPSCNGIGAINALPLLHNVQWASSHQLPRLKLHGLKTTNLDASGRLQEQ